VPIQFTVTAWQYINATVYSRDPESDMYALPPDLETTASLAQTTYRAITPTPWIVYVFIGITGALLVYGNSLFAFVLAIKTVAPNTSSFSEFDVASKAGGLIERDERNPCSVGDLSCMLREEGIATACSSDIVREFRNKKIRVVEAVKKREGMTLVLVVGSIQDDNKELEGFKILKRGVRY